MKKAIMCVFLAIVLALSAAFVSAAPQIKSTIPDQQKFMNSAPWSVDLSVYENGTEGETDEQLDWIFSGGDASLFNMSMDANNNTITFSPKSNAAGTSTVILSLTNGTSTVSQNIVVSLLKPATLSVSGDIVLGGDSQLRSNPLAEVESKEVQTVTGTLSIKNIGNETATGLAVDQVIVASGYNARDLNVTVTLDKASLSAGESATATITAVVPSYLDGVNAALDAVAMTVGSIKFTAIGAVAGNIASTTALKMQAKNMLKISDVDVKVGDETTGGSDGKAIKDIKPGEDISITIEVENRYKESDNVDIDDIVVAVRSDDLDVDEEDDLVDLSPGDKDSIAVNFNVDSDQDEGTYTLEILVEGVDENGARHGESWTLNFEVVREKYEISILSATLTPSSADAGDDVELKVRMKNIGTKDDDQVALHVSSPDLKFGKVLNDLSLDENDELTETFMINVPKDTKPGTYRIEIKSFSRVDDVSDTSTVSLVVRGAVEENKCAGVSCPTNSKVCADGFVASCTETCSPQTGFCVDCTPDCTGHDGGSETTDEEETPDSTGFFDRFTSGAWYIALLALLNLFVIVIGIIVIVRLIRG